ncbi:Single-stranded DNA-binding protein 2, partial [Xenoophorus captivus]
PFMSPRYPGGPRPPLRLPNQGLGGVPGSQPMLPAGMDPTRQQGHPSMGGPMQRMTPPRGMVPLGPQVWDNNRMGSFYKAITTNFAYFIGFLSMWYV